MSRITKVMTFSLPPAVAQEIEEVAQQESRTKSELLREVWRVYRVYRKRRPEPEMDETLTLQIMLEAQAEQRANPMSPVELKAEFRKLSRYGAKQAKKMGINVEDEETINRLVHAARVQRRQGEKNRA